MPAKDETKSAFRVADLTLERLRRLEVGIEDVKLRLVSQDQKLNALIDLATGPRADFAGFMKLYAAQKR
jgi:hypothetical protein